MNPLSLSLEGSDPCTWGIGVKTSVHPFCSLAVLDPRVGPVASLPALGPWAPPAERGPSLESIYRVSLTVDF